MKIGIFSLPLNWNYGGILQQCALRRVLKDMGHEVFVFSRRMDRDNRLLKGLVIIKWRALKAMSAIPLLRFLPLVGVQPFKARHLPELSDDIFDDASMKRVSIEAGLQAIVVGSDQVWNCRAAPKLHNYFLDFTQGLSNLRRIAYAASFGKSEWLYSPEDTEVCAKLVQHFDAVSVREDSGVELCCKHLNVDADLMPDPALLLTRDGYVEMISKARVRRSEKVVLTYILDATGSKSRLIRDVAGKLQLSEAPLMPRGRMEAFKWGLKGHHATVEQWLCGFYDADFIVTDSFHGTLFAVLFNKPFIAIANEGRGVARFQSFLTMVGLEDRLVFENSQYDNLVNKQVDWVGVNDKVYVQRKRALDFIKDGLGEV